MASVTDMTGQPFWALHFEVHRMLKGYEPEAAII